MLNHKILIWGAKSKALILLNMIKNNELFYQNKRIKSKKINLLVDPFLKKPEFSSSVPFVNKKNHFIKNLKKINSFIVGIGGGHGKARHLISKELIKKKLKPLSLIHKTSFIDKTSFLGVGVQVMPNVVVHCYSRIGDFTILNTSSTIDHECEVGQGVHIMGGVSIAGKVKIGDYVTIGTNATIFPGIKISDGAFIGAGSVVRKDVKKNEIVIGNPSKFLRKNKHFYDLSFFK
jgi:acetyltransferase EpsM|tara:strand:+ start:237 stop:935 length:699 start_codon:yes stop_codon:yes gene_type:complete